ncbi:uroporphyrinogen-III synthase [Sphingomonas sp.]|uniref:uroporphyrinogen-III synthase n=1 Tax=Sphingomonas sp. TaxID=28214 RepID=UPI0025D5505F|nr:uroporphyrinogen-III synthase [Sphingomonas sp.]
MRKLTIIRPEPGASETVARAAAMGIEAVALPLFAIERVAWSAPDPHQFDALLLTSANAVRHAGPGLARFHRLPVHAVGAATADAARAAGFSVASVGGTGVDALLAALPDGLALLHLGGEHRHAPRLFGKHVFVVPVYRSAATAPGPAAIDRLAGSVVALHSARAGARLSDVFGFRDRSGTALVALSAQAGADVGPGWEQVAVAGRPTDSALLALAAELCLDAAE